MLKILQISWILLQSWEKLGLEFMIDITAISTQQLNNADQLAQEDQEMPKQKNLNLSLNFQDKMHL